MASNVRSFSVSHQEGYSLAEGSEVPENKLVADSIRVELRRLRALEDELNNSIAQEVSAKGGPASQQTALDRPDVFAPYVSPVRSSRHGGGGGGGSPASNKFFTSSYPPRPAFPIGGPASSHNTYAVDLDTTGRFIPATSGEQPQSMSITTKGQGSPSSKKGPPSFQQWSPAVFSSSSAVAAVADPSAVYLEHYQRKYDEVIARREAAEAAKHKKEDEAEEASYGLLLDDAKRSGHSAAAGNDNKETRGGGGGRGRDLSLLSTVGGIGVSEVTIVDGGPHAVIKPFAVESFSDVESGIGDVRSSILELKAKREQRELLAKLEEKARVGRTVADDAVEALLRDAESAQQMKYIVSKSTKAGGLPDVYRNHLLLGGVLGARAEGRENADRLINTGIGGRITTVSSSLVDSNQHSLFVEFNTDRKAIAEASAASAAAYELSQIPFANSRIGREFNDRKRRVYSAHISKEHDIEVTARQHFLKNSTASITFGEPPIASERKDEAKDNDKNAKDKDCGAISLATSNLPPLISSFVVSRHVPSTLPKSSHSAVVGGAFHTILKQAEAGKPIVNLDDLPEEPRVLVQLTSVVPIAGRTAFTIPLTLSTPLRVLQQEVMSLAGLQVPSNSAVAQGDEHARTASAAWPGSATYQNALANAHASAVFRGKISPSTMLSSSIGGGGTMQQQQQKPSINNNYAYNTFTNDITAPSRMGSALNRPNPIAQGHRPLTRPNTALAPTAEGGVTLYVAGADVPLDLDKSFLELGYRFPPLVAVRGYRQEYYLTTAGSDRRIPCVWRPHMTMTDVAKDIAKRLNPYDFRHVRASISSVENGSSSSASSVAYRRAYLPLEKSVRFQTPDLIEGNPFLWEVLGLSPPPNATADFPPPVCSVQFMRSVDGDPFIASSGQVSTAMRLNEYCQEAAAACQQQLDSHKESIFIKQRSSAIMGGARTGRGSAVFPLNSVKGLQHEHNTTTDDHHDDDHKNERSHKDDTVGLNTVQFDDIDEAISPSGVYSVFRHRDLEAQTGIPTFSFNPTLDYVAEARYPYFIGSEEDFTIRHASDCGVVPGAEVLVEFFDPYRKVWSAEVMPAGESIYDPPIIDSEGNTTYSSKGERGAKGLLLSATLDVTVPTTAQSQPRPRLSGGKNESQQALTFPQQETRGPFGASSRPPATYPISSEEAQHARIAIQRPSAADRYDLLTIVTVGGQRLRMFASDKTRVDTIHAFIWGQTGSSPSETYVWTEGGQCLSQHYETLQEAGIMPSSTVHARGRPKGWLKEKLEPPQVDRTMSYTALPDTDVRRL